MTRLVLEGPARGFVWDPEHGDHRRGRSPRISDLAITELAVIWLQKQPGMAADDHLRSALPAMLPAPPGGSTNRATWVGETDR